MYTKVSIPMKKILFILFSILFIGCDEKKEIERPSIDAPVYYIDGNRIIQVTLDSCEYFICTGQREHSMVHKGNCSNPIHSQK